jgi:hypothetical protein
MPRQRQRACLEGGRRLDLNRLIRIGVVKPGAAAGPHAILWTGSDQITIGTITADMTGTVGWLRIQIGSLDQSITLLPCPRHFGGRQWYFVCPYMGRRASVLWRPPGASVFACRQKWAGQVAYASQFEGRDARAHRGQAKVKQRLIADLDPGKWDLPPKPKWMRWRTYNRAVEKFDHYEEILDERLVAIASRLL